MLISHTLHSLLILVVSLPCCIPTLQVFNPLLFSSNMRMTSGKSQPGKQLEHRCPVCNVAFHPQAFSAHVQKCEHLKKAEEGKNKYERELQEVLLAKITCACHSVVSFIYTSHTPPFQSQVGPRQQMQAMTLVPWLPPSFIPHLN